MVSQTLTIFRFSGLRYLRRHWLRQLVSLLGVVMGVATFIFGPTIVGTLQSAFTTATHDLHGRAALEIRTTDGAPFAADALPNLRAVDGVAVAAPLALSGGIVVGQRDLMVFLGIDADDDQAVRVYKLSAGDFAREGAVLLSAKYAAEYGYQVGQRLTFFGVGGLRTLTLVGTLAEEGIGRLNSGDLAIMARSDLAALRGNALIDSISILPREGTDTAALQQRLQASVPSLSVAVPSGRGGSLFAEVAAFIMAGVSLIILSLGATLIYGAISVAVAQRRSEIGVLRALGMTRHSVQRLFIAESAVLGMVGGILGIGLGYLMVSVGDQLPVLPKNNTSAFTSAVSLSVAPSTPLIAFGAAIGFSMLAGGLAARAATQIDPVEALAGIRAQRELMTIQGRRLIIAAALIGIALLIGLLSQPNLQGVVLTNISAYSLLAAAAMLTPPMLLFVGQAVLPFLSRTFGASGRIAAQNLTQRTRRVAAVGILLSISIGVSFVVTGANFGYRTFIEAWQQGENVFDLGVMGAGRDALMPSLPLPEGVAEAVAARADVAHVLRENIGLIRYNGADSYLRALDFAALRAAGGRLVWSDGDEASGYARLPDLNQPSLLAAGMANFMAGITIGSQVTLETPRGTVTFEVLGNTYGIVDQGMFIMDLAVYQHFWGDQSLNRLALKAAPEADLDALRRDLTRQFAPRGALVYDSEMVAAAFMSRFDSITTVSRMLSSLLLIIVVAGLASALFVAVLDRRRELGMLRAVGMTRGQVTRSVLIEALLLIGVGLLVGVPWGVLASTFNTVALHKMMGIQFGVNLTDVGITLLFAVGIGVVAAYFPSRQAARTDILVAMRYE